MARFVEGDNTALSATRSCDSVNRRVVGVEEPPSVPHSENGGDVGIDDASVAHDGDTLRTVLRNDRLDRGGDPRDELFLGLVRCGPFAADQFVPARVVGSFQFLDGYVPLTVSVVFRHSVDDRHIEAECSGNWSCSLLSAKKRARVDGVERLRGEVLGEQLGLLHTVFGEFRISCPGFEFSSYRYSVPDQNDFHSSGG